MMNTSMAVLLLDIRLHFFGGKVRSLACFWDHLFQIMVRTNLDSQSHQDDSVIVKNSDQLPGAEFR